MVEEIRPYAAAARESSLEEFLAKHPHPVLLLKNLPEEADTDTWTRIRVEQPTDGSAPDLPLQVASIVKREGANKFSMITIGRARTNDICIPAGEISKVHAYITLEEDQILLTDAGSTNGTLVRGLRLEPKEDRVALASGDDLTLGVIPVAFYRAGDFYRYLRGLTEAGNG